ncbi:hypothetical protein KFK09_014769 [Dendrobium nobile]|uniref:Integrase catalytic domain-containing protein n=1 Tax=Dendrobium nobile TaxID=94219 RepID=A0A8T3B8V0_DENNO|nr:hypothetical protein KFK09_014769 [Dendrobium nobile]
MVKNQFNTTIHTLRSDAGGEYTGNMFKQFLQTHGINHEFSCPNTPQQNGVSERKHRHLLETTCTFLHAAHLPFRFWAEALQTGKHTGTQHLGLPISKGSLDLTSYCDADWASDSTDRKSITGFCTFLGKNLISWCVKKQTMVAKSSTEAEYRSLASSLSDVIWLRRLLLDFHIHLHTPTTIFCDNLSTLALAQNPVFHARTKHIEIDHHFISDHIKQQTVNVAHIDSEDQFDGGLENVHICDSATLGNCISDGRDGAVFPPQSDKSMDNAWNMKPNFKSIDFDFGENFLENGVVKLHQQNEADNTSKLKKSLVIKVLGNATYHIIGQELRRKWNLYGRFYMTLLGGGWVLCAFEEFEAMEAVLNSGPWYVNGSIIVLDKWSPSFDPSSMKGLTALWGSNNLPGFVSGSSWKTNFNREFGLKENSKLMEVNYSKTKKDGYGPWIHVDYGRKKIKISNFQNKWKKIPISYKKSFIVERNEEQGGAINNFIQLNVEHQIVEKIIEKVKDPVIAKDLAVNREGYKVGKRGGKERRKFLFNLGTKEMKSFISCNDLHEVSCVGPKFTWCNNKKGAERILEKMDRCLVNSAAFNSPHRLMERHLARIASDHSPILLNLLNFSSPARKVFRFEEVWTSIPASKTIVRESWRRKAQGDPSQALNQKMKRTLRNLLYWSKAKFKELRLSKEELKVDILIFQEKEADGGELSEDEQWKLKAKIEELNTVLARINTTWRQRAKIKWLMDGDTNSRFFQAFASARMNLNYIHNIKNEQGDLVEDQKEIKVVLFQFFNNKWEDRVCILNGWPVPVNTLEEVDKEFLNRRFSIEELEKVIKELRGNIAPGQDEQVAFMKGRSLSNHVLVAQEVFHKFRHSNSSKGMVSFKIDIEQAYDSMGWPTLNNVLKYFEFLDFYANLIMECVIGPKFSLLINGIYSKWIDAKCGFRQGSPLSPFLFVLRAQLLSNAFLQSGNSIGISISSNSPKFSHLLYADDIMVFSEAKLESVKVVKGIILEFCGWTSQKINFQKSGVLFGRSVKKGRRKKICKIMKFRELHEFTYLGTKVALRRLNRASFQFIMDKVLNKLTIWGGKLLSLARKITLVISILHDLPTFNTTLSLVPKQILIEVEKACRKFIWSKGDGTRRSRSVSWKLICNGGNFLKPIVRWSIGNESSVNVLKDTWIFDKGLMFWPTFINPMLEDDQLVERFIINGVWNVQELQEFFGKDLLKLITSIQIHRREEDRLELIHKFSGKSLTALATKAIGPVKAESALLLGTEIQDVHSQATRVLFNHLGCSTFGTMKLQSILSLKSVIRGWMKNYKGLVIEGDNKNVINFIKRKLEKGAAFTSLSPAKGIMFGSRGEKDNRRSLEIGSDSTTIFFQFLAGGWEEPPAEEERGGKSMEEKGSMEETGERRVLRQKLEEVGEEAGTRREARRRERETLTLTHHHDNSLSFFCKKTQKASFWDIITCEILTV